MELDRNCNECGADSWTKLVEDDYPERRRERDRTVKRVYHCQECGAEGRHFDRQESGTEQYSGALR
jgi:hypothetical protein